MEDSAIIELYWQRSETAIAHTAEKYGAYCGSISMNIVSSKEDAMECVNDTYLHTWNAIPPNRPSVFRTWLGRICRNLSLDRYKRQGTKKRGGDAVTVLFGELELCVPGSWSVERHLEEAEVAAVISAFLWQSSKTNRIIFVRRYYYGDSIGGISERLGMGESRVKSSLQRTRRKLLACLEREGVDL